MIGVVNCHRLLFLILVAIKRALFVREVNLPPYLYSKSFVSQQYQKKAPRYKSLF